MTTDHRHTFGVKGRLTGRPHADDLCLTCPASWEQRGRRDIYVTPEYRPRTRPHRIRRVEEAA